MAQRHQRVGQRHARAGIAHHRAHAFAHFGAVAVDRAARAGGLALPKGAFLQPFQGVILQLAAIGAQLRAPAVLTAAVQAQHRFQRFGLAR